MKDKNITYIFENIISKAKYNEQLGKWVIREIDYINLDLSTNQKKLLKRMCENLEIELEYKGYTKDLLPCVVDENLFQQYNEIKSKLEFNPTSSELTKQRIEIRNKILSDNIDFVRSILNRRLDGIKEMEDSDDIYQIGYEILLKYIDSNYLNKDTFKNNISKILMLYTSRKILIEKEGIGHCKKQQMNSLSDEKRISSSDEIEELTKQLNLKRKTIEELLTLKEILNAISIEEEIAKINQAIQNDDSPLYYSDFEEQMIEQLSRREIIIKIVSTLPKQQRDILNLYFGFDNEMTYTMQEIANMYGLTKNRISAIINKALTTIKETSRIYFILEIYSEKDFQVNIDSFQERKLEEFLLQNLPEELYDKVYKEIPSSLDRQLFSLISQNPEYEIINICKILGKTLSQVHALKDKMYNTIRKILMEILKTEGKITYKEYLNYLMKNYLNIHQVCIKKRSK